MNTTIKLTELELQKIEDRHYGATKNFILKYDNRVVSTKGMLYKALSTSKLFEEQAEGRFVIENAKELFEEALIKDLDLVSIAIRIAAADNAISDDQAELLQNAKAGLESYQEIRNVSNAIAFLISGAGKMSSREITAAIEKFSRKKVYSFSKYSVVDEKIKTALTSVIRYATNMNVDRHYAFSYRQSDIMLMSYGISQSCYSSEGLYSHAPIVICSMPNTYTGYSYNSDRCPSEIPMRRSRFFGTDSEEYLTHGRHYGDFTIKFILDLVMQLNYSNEVESTYGKEIFEKYTIGGFPFNIADIYPNGGLTYTADWTGQTVGLYVNRQDSGTYFAAIAKLHADANKTNSEKGVHLFCPDCNSEHQGSTGREHTLSCCMAAKESCEDCGERHDEDDMYYISDHGQVCYSCYNESDTYGYCEGYEEYMYCEDGFQEVDCETYSLRFLNNEAQYCDHCESYVFNGTVEVDDNYFCDVCAAEETSICPECSELFINGNAVGRFCSEACADSNK